MRPKGKLFALLAVFAAIGLVTASGAFTTVEADRTATVNVEGDSSALLGISAADTNNGNAYASTSGDGLTIQFTTGNSGDGLNPDAQTSIGYVVNVTNQGTQDVTLSAGYSDDNADFTTLDGDITSASDSDFFLYNNTELNGDDVTVSGNTLTPLDNQDNTVTLSPGDTVSLGVYVDTTGIGSSSSFDVTITLEASA